MKDDDYSQVRNPTSPDEIPAFVPVHHIARTVGVYHNLLANAAAGDTNPHPEVIREASVDLLVSLSAVAERATAQRWPRAVDALHAGASRERVARALGMTPGDMGAGLREWVAGQRESGELDEDLLDDIECLIDAPDGSR